jgi:RNase H-fold protein (predicted Holliday junction resolvase)
MSSAGKALSKFLTSPNSLAQSLDWKAASGSVLSLTIGRSSIGLAVAGHPQFDEVPQSLPSIPIKSEFVDNKNVICPAVAEELASIIKDWKVCGLVVNWPVQQEGWCGAPCGRVLYTLDQLLASSKSKIVNASRKICLWQQVDSMTDQIADDEWGRNPVYCETSDKKIHYASEEQYEGPSTVAADVWNDFCRVHWPELYQYKEESTSKSSPQWLVGGKTSDSDVDFAWLDSYENTAAYAKASL